MTPTRDPEEEREMAERLWDGTPDPRVDDLRALSERLEAEGAAERDAFVRAALEAGPVEHEDDVIAALAEAMDETPATATPMDVSAPQPGGRPGPQPGAQPAAKSGGWRAPAGPMLSWWWIAGAVAAVLVAVYAPELFPTMPGNEAPTDGGDAPLILGDQDAGALVAPVGRVERVEAFTWSHAPVDGATYRVSLWFGAEATGSHDRDALAFEAPRWEPDSILLDNLNAPGSVFTWAVVEVDPTGVDETVLGTATVVVEP